MADILSIVAIVCLLGFAAFLLWDRKSKSRNNEEDQSLFQKQINENLSQMAAQVEQLRRGVTDTVQNLAGQMAQGLANTNAAVGSRLDTTGKVLGDLRQQLGQLEKSSLRLLEVGQDIAKLEDLLKPPKLRGSLGELFLADLIAQVLPANHYELQHRFKGGEAVDAVIFLNAGMVPIDAKFPLENFRKILAAENEEERKKGKRQFVSDIKGHVDSIAQKYIRMDEGTFDFAFMYIPAENVYYETIVRDDEFGGEQGLFEYALKKRVIPISPNTFYVYLQTIILGLKGMRVEEQSREILEGLSRLQKELGVFSETFRLVGQHLDNSAKKYMEAEKRLGKIEVKVEQMDGLARDLGSGSEREDDAHGNIKTGETLIDS